MDLNKGIYLGFKILLFLILLLNKGLILSQKLNEEIIDSIRKMERNFPDKAIQLAQHYLYSNFDLDSIEKGNLYVSIGKAYFYKTEYDSSLLYMNNAERIFPNYCVHERADVYTTLGVFYGGKQEWEKAYNSISQSIKLSERTKDTSLINKTYINQATLFTKIGDYDRALNTYLKCIDFSKFTNDSLRLYYCFWGIGNVHYYTKNFDQALLWYKKTYKLATDWNEPQIKCNVLINIAEVQLDLDSINQASVVIDSILSLTNEIDYKFGYAHGIVDKAKLFLKKQELDSAYFWYQKAVDVSQEIGLEAVEVDALLNIAKLSIDDKRYIKAENVLAELVNSPLQPDFMLKACELYSDVLKNQGKFKEALQYKQKTLTIKDSLLNKEMFDKLSNLRVKYEIGEKESDFKSEKKLLLAKKKKQLLLRNILISLLIILLIAAFLIFRIFKLRQIAKLHKLKEEVSEIRQKMLAQQLNPHFIFNTLNSIQYFIEKNDREASKEFLSSFAMLMRKALEYSQQDFITLENEAFFLGNYLILEQKRLRNKFDYEIIIDKSIDKSKIGIPPFLIQPSVENSLKHGLSDGKRSKISLIFAVENKLLKCIVKDNGAGISTCNKLLDHKSMANELTKRRLKILEKIYQKNATFSIKNWSAGQESGCEATYHLPLMTIL